MKTLNFAQKSPEWYAHRATARNASEAPAVLGCSPYQTRAQLLHARYTGIRPEVDAAQQRRFDDGHAIEAAQLPFAESIIGQALYAVVGSAVVDGIELSASFDGLTLMEDTAYECKTLNDKLREALPNFGPDDNDAAKLPKMYRVQMQQQLMVSGASRVLFVAASKDGEDVRCCWYEYSKLLHDEIIAAWKQFDADLAAYVPSAHSAVEKVIAESVEAFPSPVVTVTGQLALQDNFKTFEARLRDFLDNKLIRQPVTDQDFADLDGQIKAMKQAEAALDAAEGHMLAQITAVDQAKKTKDMLARLVRDNRLMAEKLLTAEKERRKGEIVAAGVTALKSHIDALNSRIGRPFMPNIDAYFAGAVRGLKSLASMEEKVDAELNRAKIAASQVADGIDANLKFLNEHASDYKALFADTAQLVLKPADDFQAMVRGRIAEHQATLQRQAEAAAEKAREAIRAEERAKAEKEAQKQALAHVELAQLAITLIAPEAVVPTVLPVDNVVALPVCSAPTADPGAMVKLGELNAMLAPISLTAHGLAEIGFSDVTVKNAKMYRVADIGHICAALVARIQAIQARQAA